MGCGVGGGDEAWCHHYIGYSFQLAARYHYMFHPTDRRVHTTTVTPVVEYWLQQDWTYMKPTNDAYTKMKIIVCVHKNCLIYLNSFVVVLYIYKFTMISFWFMACCHNSIVFKNLTIADFSQVAVSVKISNLLICFCRFDLFCRIFILYIVGIWAHLPENITSKGY